MANFHVTIQNVNGVCRPNPQQIPPPGGKIVHNDTVTFGNQTGNTATLNFNLPNGSPFGINPVPVPATGTQPLPITVNPSSQTTYTYSTDCSGMPRLSGDGPGIIIVDGGGMPGPRKPAPKKASAKPAAKRPKAKPKAKPKKKSKAKPKGKGKAKAKGGKKAAPKRKAGKGRSKKK